MATLDEAIRYICPKAEFTYLEEDYNTIEWFCLDMPEPTIEEIQQAMKAVDRQKAIESLESEYAEKMLVAKDKLFDAMMIDDQEAIAAAKTEYAQLKTELESKKSKM